MYNRAFPIGNALFLIAGGMMSLFRLPRGKLPLPLLAVPAGKDRRVECPCQTVLDVTMAQGSGIHSGCFYIFWMTAPIQRHMVSPA